MRKQKIAVSFLLLSLLLVACGATAEEAESSSAVQDDSPSATATKRPALPTPTATEERPPTEEPAREEGLIIFSSTRLGIDGVFAVNPVSTKVSLLSAHPEGSLIPHWSPDGSQFSITRVSGERSTEILVLETDGSAMTALTGGGHVNLEGVWSPDGSKLAFVSGRDGNPEIYLMDEDGSNIMRLTNHMAADQHISWSADGKSIVFGSDRDGNEDIYRIDVDGSNLQRLTDNNAEDLEPDWSPDGKKITFTSMRDGNTEIYTMDAEGGNIERLTNNSDTDQQPTWSPDGTQIAFVSFREGSSDIYAIDADGGNTVRLTFDSDDEIDPDWGEVEDFDEDEPWFGHPFCARDSDGDFSADEITDTFTTEEIIGFVAFTYRQMEDGMEWSHSWTPEEGTGVNNMAFWDGGETGIYVATNGVLTMLPPGGVTIELMIDEKVLQETKCQIVEP